ncbi:protein of unknown function (plasmid) [Cupriavidus taiwanensis]|nr:protein of unknown function [Cupriavidus taiwanensis]
MLSARSLESAARAEQQTTQQSSIDRSGSISAGRPPQQQQPTKLTCSLNRPASQASRPDAPKEKLRIV